MGPTGPSVAGDQAPGNPDDALIPRGPGFRLTFFTVGVVLVLLFGIITVAAVLAREYRPRRRVRRRRRYDDDY
jgi:hypothetical protein